MTKLDFGSALKIARTARSMSQQELAEKSNVDRSYVSLLETNKRSPSTGLLETFSRVLEVPPFLLVLLASRSDSSQKGHIALDSVAKSLLALALEDAVPS
ncbi:MAG: helix-turn-helix transcriptional regulator [Thermoanaerobaculia bacterium]|nr:helix-turn-helix transcriptional regulator [Thermoanaerobaculia bacterium]